MKRRHILSAAAAAAAAGTLPGLALAQAAFPNKPMKILVPFTAGSGADSSSRFYGEQLSKMLNQTVTVEGVSVEKWAVEAAYASGLGGVDVSEPSPGTLTIKPLAGYDALADPKDFVKSADGATTFSVAEGTFTVQVEGVDQ